jgi:hypothetical protein
MVTHISGAAAEFHRHLGLDAPFTDLRARGKIL